VCVARVLPTRMRIRNYLLIIALLAGIPGLAVAAYFMWWSAALQKSSIEQGIRDTARALSLAVDREMFRARAIARTIAASPDIDIERFDRVHAQAVAMSDQSGWVALVKPNAEQVLNALVPYGQPIPRAAATDLISEVSRTGDSRISNLLVGAVASRPIVSVGAPVIRGNQVIGVAVFATGVERFQQLLTEQALPQGWIASIVDRNGITIARNYQHDRFVTKPVGPALLPLLKAEKGSGTGVTRDGFEVFFTWATSPESGWRVALAAPTEIVDAPMRAMFFFFAAAVGLVAAGLAAALIIGRRMTRNIASSVNQLSEAAIALGEDAPISLRDGAAMSEIDAARSSLRWAYDAVRERAAEQNRARQEAVAANQAKDEFIATLAHEVRSPLSAIAMAAEALDKSQGGASREAAIIKRQVAHLSRLVNDLLDAGRVAMNKFIVVRMPMNLTEAVRHCIETLSYDKDGLQVHLHAAENIWIEGDETRIHQVISNLLTNAVKFTPKGGAIDVSVKGVANQAIVDVRDTGVGIPPELLPRIFELFVQGERVEAMSSGMGIGLALVRRLVELHGGSVSGASEGRGRGTTFTITLPSIKAPASAAAA
jgi:signal transduction histidine kinase